MSQRAIGGYKPTYCTCRQIMRAALDNNVFISTTSSAEDDVTSTTSSHRSVLDDALDNNVTMCHVYNIINLDDGDIYHDVDSVCGRSFGRPYNSPFYNSFPNYRYQS